MHIIRAKADDLDALVRLNKVVQDRHAACEPVYFHPFDEVAVRAYFVASLDDAAVSLLIAFEDDMPLGYVTARACERVENPFSRSRTYLELEHIAVLPEARGRGIGSMLVDEVFAAARALGVASVELSVWEFNDDARRLFARKGFDVCWKRMRRGLGAGTED